MAVAHVSGLAALLLEEDPKLLPHDLVFQIRETAWRFTDPNDIRGWGRIDTVNAVNFLKNPDPWNLKLTQQDRHWKAGRYLDRQQW